MTDLEELEAAAEKASPIPWRVGDRPLNPKCSILVQGAVDTCPGASVWSQIAIFDLVEATDGDGRHWYAAGTADANCAYAVAAVNVLPSLIARVRAAEAKLEKARDGLVTIAASAPSAEQLGVNPGMDYWCTVAVRRQDRATTTLREIE
jgi:hypothetical protein